jgi:tetratricopeptide (TPR) repeat protein
MTDIDKTEVSADSLVGSTDHGAANQSDIDSVVKDLGADRADIERLLVYLDGKAVSPQQVPVLLKQAYGRLQKLRGTLADCTVLTTADTEMAGMIQQLNSAIQPGNSFSFDDAAKVLAAIYSRCVAQDVGPESAAMVRGMQALVAAARHEYQNAAQYYAESAMTPGLTTEVQWQYQIDRAMVLEDYGREFGYNPALEQSISLLENEAISLAPRQQRAEDWATTKHILGNVLGVLGQRQVGTRNLENSIAAFKASLSRRERKVEPLQWADTQNSLGNALGILGHRQNDVDMLAESIAAFERSLEERTRDTAPQEWATTLNNLAAVLQSLGQRNKDTKMLKRSVNTYKEVLQQWTRERAPENWATTLNNLGTALRLLGEHRKGPRTLEQSVAAYNSALAERSREQWPQEWAMTQNNLGAALQKLGEREENPEMLERAVNAYESALKEWTREWMPMAWAMTMANLGVARRTLAAYTEDVESACKAVEELEAVSEVFRNASHAQYSELSIDQLAKARKLADTLAGH